MINWPCRLTLVALALQSTGCAAGKIGTYPGEMRAAPNVREDARQEDAETRPGSDAPSASVAGPALAYAEIAQDSAISSFLATESTLIVEDSISIDRSREMLEDNALFSSALASMLDEEKTSTEAQRLASHHRDVLERAVGQLGVVEDLTCGLSLCIGSVLSLTQADHEAWSRRLVKDPAARRYGAVHSYEPMGEQLQHRFVFSADPAVAALFLSR